MTRATSPRSATALAALLAAASAANSPKTADPLPVISAASAPADSSVRRAAPISGCRRATGASRSFTSASRRPGHASMDASARRRAPAVARESLVEPAIGVRRGHAERGQGQHHGEGPAGRRAGTARRRATARAPSRQGESTARRSRAPRRSPRGPPAPRAAARGRRGPRAPDAASELPPPSPACIGMCLVRWTATPRGSPSRPSADHSARAARVTRLRSSTGTPGSLQVNAKGPGRGVTSRVSCSASDWNTVWSG